MYAVRVNKVNEKSSQTTGTEAPIGPLRKAYNSIQEESGFLNFTGTQEAIHPNPNRLGKTLGRN